MNEQDKQLLLKVLCAMLPHGIHLYVEHDWFEDEVPPYTCKATAESHDIITNFANNPITCSLSIKPYLRSMSSMTEEELYEWTHTWIMDSTAEKYDWLNEHHLDYRGLIPMGLALPAPEGMYND